MHLLEAHAELNALLENPIYSPADKARMLVLLEALGLLRSDSAEMAVLPQVRGRLLKRPRSGGVEVIAGGRGAWAGWVDLTTEPVTEAAVANTARVINDLAPDLLGVVEAENRVVLTHFTDAQLGAEVRYPHVMLIDGNEDRGIDVTILTKEGWPLGTVRSHVDDIDGSGVILGRDCPEYEVRTPGGHRLVVLVNHLKSKGYGSQADNNERRRRQPQRVADIYRRLRKDGVSYVVVLDDFNQTPSSAPVSPLMDATDLRDVSEHTGFDDGGRPGTFGTCAAANRID